MLGYVGTAKPIAKVTGLRGDAKIYRMDPPLQGNHYVLISAIEAEFTGPETYIFPCTPDGKVLDWEELRGSYRGDTDHSIGLKAIGYKIKY